MKQNSILNKTAIFPTLKRNFVTRLIAQLLLLRKRHQTIKQLNSLSDSILKDIGIERYEIAQAVKTPASYKKLISRRTQQASELVRLKIAA